jgi:hypothetical protein
MFNVIDANDPLAVAAVAVGSAEGLAPIVRHRLPMLLAGDAGADCCRVADLLEQADLFERPTNAALREFLAALEDALEATFVERRDWVPVRCLDGYEDYEEVTIRRRDARGDAIAAIAAELETVIDPATRTVALRRAAELLGRRP